MYKCTQHTIKAEKARIQWRNSWTSRGSNVRGSKVNWLANHLGPVG